MKLVTTSTRINNQYLIRFRYINEETYRQKTEFESNGFYFLPDPMAFALDHHCTELQWALLPDPRLGLEAGNAPRTLREFEDDPRRPGFYVFRCSQVISAYCSAIFSLL